MGHSISNQHAFFGHFFLGHLILLKFGTIVEKLIVLKLTYPNVG